MRTKRASPGRSRPRSLPTRNAIGAAASARLVDQHVEAAALQRGEGDDLGALVLDRAVLAGARHDRRDPRLVADEALDAHGVAVRRSAGRSGVAAKTTGR